MEAQSRRKGAARCTDCGRALAVWLSPDEVRPIGSSDGCPCGSTSFRVFS
ncbi:hypothetical protein [Natrinema versiforme]|nr:hypothetical protein [Natrinema versiforme]